MGRKSCKNIFDYIVIGAGTAGGVIAKKLSDDKRTSVLVLEAGTNMTDELSSPDLAVSLTNATDNRFTFNVATRLEEQIGRQLITQSGRAIGGSSEHNAMYSVRGSEDLYDAWAAIAGDSSWNYESLRDLFIENETYKGMTQSSEERGTNGPIFVRQQNIPNQGLIQVLAQATNQTYNIPIVKDYNSGIRDCTFFKSQFIQKVENGKLVRSSTATGYLNEEIVTQGNEFVSDEFGIGGRKLVIKAKTTVNKILFKQKRGIQIAVGVEIVKNGVTESMFARKGVIVSAGQFSSVILQRSGIGKPEDLARAGITTLIDSPQVGYNFQSHYFVGMGVRVETLRLLQVLNADPNQPVALGAFKKTDDSIGGRRLQLLGLPFPLFVPNHVVHINGWAFDPEQPSNIMSLGISDINPRSRGTVMIAHSDPKAYPSISLNPLSDANDLEYMVDQYIEAYNMILKARQMDLDGIYEVVYPDESIFQMPNEIEKRATLAAYVRASYAVYSHFGGQCKMGTSITNSVVNEELIVHGTKNLRVADLSISPILPDGNTSTAAQIIGLNAVRFIQSDTFSVDVKEFEDYIENEESS